MDRLKPELNPAADACPMVRLFEHYGLTGAAQLIADTQKEIVTR
jgi:hypothetical protein